MSKLVLASLCFTLFTSLALAKELIFATGPDGGLFRVFASGISEYLNQNQDEHPVGVFSGTLAVHKDGWSWGTKGILIKFNSTAISSRLL